MTLEQENKALRAEVERLKKRYEGLGDGADGETVQKVADQREEILALRAEVERLNKRLSVKDWIKNRFQQIHHEAEVSALRAEVERWKEAARCKTIRTEVRPVPILVIEECEGCTALRAKLAKAEEALCNIGNTAVDPDADHWIEVALAAIREEKP